MIEELKRVQLEIARKVDLRDRYKLEDIEYVIGVDQSFYGEMVISAAVKFSFPELKEVDRKYSIEKVNFPYIPTFLMFREGEPALKAVNKLFSGKCVIIVDGSGIAHPRKCGLATYIAIKTNTPTIGVTKRKLYGEIVEENGRKLIKDGEEILGFAFKPCKNCSEIYISPGSFISPEKALEIVALCTKRKLPEPLKAAHNYANELRKKLPSTKTRNLDDFGFDSIQ